MNKMICLLFALSSIVPQIYAQPPLIATRERAGVVTINIDLRDSAAKTAKIWLPYPVSDQHQRVSDVTIGGNLVNSATYKEPESGALYLFGEWLPEVAEKSLEFKFRVRAERSSVPNLVENSDPIPAEIRQYLGATELIPTDGKVAEIARNITKNRRGILDKAQAVYDWVVENTSRDPSVKGCGAGVVERTLARRSGKCADLSSVYVALARSAGVPAREVFGLRLGQEERQDITGGYHCWAEFYLPGTGWVPVDPADVRKLMLVEHLDLKAASNYRKFYFGNVDTYRIALQKGGRGIKFQPRQEAGPLNYFMYPYVEVDGKALDYLEPESFHYSVNFEAISLTQADEPEKGLQNI